MSGDAKSLNPLTCPFCGRDDPRIVRKGRAFYIECRGCYVATPVVTSEAAAIAIWNTRAGLIEAVEIIKALTALPAYGEKMDVAATMRALMEAKDRGRAFLAKVGEG